MFCTSCVNTHHDVTTFEVDGLARYVNNCRANHDFSTK